MSNNNYQTSHTVHLRVNSRKEKYIAKSKGEITVLDESGIRKIYLMRGKKVMIDRDLAEMHGVETN